MARYEVPVEVRLPAGRPARIADNGKPSERNQLTVRVSGDRVSAKWPARTGFDNPPQFLGQVRPDGDGATVSGSIRESLAASLWSRIMRVVLFWMIALAVFGAVLLITNGAHYGLAPLLIGVVGAPLAGLLWRRLARQRKPNFDSDAAQLQAGLTRYLTSGDGARRSR